jgi:hypothetical protein
MREDLKFKLDGTEDHEANEVFSSFPLFASVEFLEGEAEGGAG